MTEEAKSKALEKDLGFALDSRNRATRVINDDGSFNVRYQGFREISLYQQLLSYSWRKFFLWTGLTMMAINFFFAGIFFLIGPQHFSGITATDPFNEFLFYLYFSFQTFSTVGYGGITPLGHWANIFATMDSLIGLLFVAMATALFFARFSQPRASLRFSKNIILAPYKKDSKALMFRFVNNRRHSMTEVNIRVASRMEKKMADGTYHSNFQELPLERNEIMFFPYNWTIVHEIDEESPFYHFSKEDWKKPFEVVILVKGFDEAYGQTVQQRMSYNESDFLYGRKFEKMYSRAEDGVMDVFIDELDTAGRKPL
ncbi:ion channel [Persicobacter sp. CCB-QB2]|uniref:ion channel n=1 Tax=Persicobacter sp. CCB-QB2 TaxID=1561025 RepID=UPI00092F4C5D|nr:ion channel [Persicobacter sp. CCB-QB2]